MKKVHLYLSLSFIMLSLTLLTSCEKDSYQTAYAYGIFQAEGSLEGFFIVDNYLVSKGVHKEVKIFESETKKENDLKAIAFFNEQISKINEAELNALLDGISYEFTYAVKSSTSSPDEEAPTLESKKYGDVHFVID